MPSPQDDFQHHLTFMQERGYSLFQVEAETYADGLAVLRQRAQGEAAKVAARFPDATSPELEVEATQEFAKAHGALIRVYGRRGVPALIEAPDGHPGGLLKWAAPDWLLVLYCAKLLRYIALCGKYELRVFSPEERLQRDEREKRHAKLLDKWEIVT
jgi:hypothetical protein